MHYLTYLYANLTEEDRREHYERFIKRNADSIWENDKDASYHFGLRWSGPFDNPSVSNQASALDAFNAATIFEPKEVIVI